MSERVVPRVLPFAGETRDRGVYEKERESEICNLIRETKGGRGRGGGEGGRKTPRVLPSAAEIRTNGLSERESARDMTL